MHNISSESHFVNQRKKARYERVLMEPGRSKEKRLISERMLPKLLFHMYVQFCMNTKGEKKIKQRKSPA